MKIRGSHIAIAVVLAIFGFVVFALMRGDGGQGQSNEEFLETVRNTRTAPMPIEEKATVPPVGVALDSGPKISFPDGDIHLGTIPNDEFGRLEFPITNEGSKTLLIRDISTSPAHAETRERLEAMMSEGWDPFRVAEAAREETIAFETFRAYGQAVRPVCDETLEVPPSTIEADVELI